MEMALTIILALILILIGLMGVYSGYKFFKMYLSIVSFIFGFVFVSSIFESVSIFSVIISILCGLLFSSLSFVFYKLAVFIAFASFGASVGAWVLSNYLQVDSQLLLTLLGAGIGFIIAFLMVLLKVDKVAVIIITTLLGSYYVLTGLSGLIDGSLLQVSVTGDLLPTSLLQIQYITGRAVKLLMENSVYFIVFLLFVLSGIITQLKAYYRK